MIFYSIHWYDFRSRHSCETQLLITIDDFAKADNSRKQVSACMFDFSEIFDKAWLLHELEFQRNTCGTLAWLTAFLF